MESVYSEIYLANKELEKKKNAEEVAKFNREYWIREYAGLALQGILAARINLNTEDDILLAAQMAVALHERLEETFSPTAVDKSGDTEHA